VILVGIPAVVVCGILINEYPQYWWLALAAPPRTCQVLDAQNTDGEIGSSEQKRSRVHRPKPH
jgi:hypothetical protein